METRNRGYTNRVELAQRVRRRYLPFDEIEVGMVLAEAVRLSANNRLRLSLPAGHALTETNLRQLAAHKTEFLCVAVPDDRSNEQIAVDVAAAAAQVMHLFEGADLANPALAGLFDRVLTYRSR